MIRKQVAILIIALALLISPLIYLLVPEKKQVGFSTVGELRKNFSLFVGKEVTVEGTVRSVYLETSTLTVYIVDDNTASIFCAGWDNLLFTWGDEVIVTGVFKDEFPSWAPNQQHLFIDIQKIGKAV
ncbi:MAG: hypothetical protein AVW06_02700 [Hadesarchaea archaeon DG-33-1]|nr:MAG: hypothetical protein AVW06_02700 [Hadesarchaea archaeon DG-33-1]